MMRILTFLAIACMSALSFAVGVVERVADFAVSLIPDLTSAKPAFRLDNGHPRSPLASLRAGVA